MNEERVRLILMENVASTLFMVGVIWFVQIVHYPLYANVGDQSFSNYEQLHSNATSLIVGPPMLVEAVTAALLLCYWPAGVMRWVVVVGFVLVIVIWVSTAFLQVPCHDVLLRGFQSDVHQRLVVTNWIRTIAWSLRGCLTLSMIWSMLKP